MAKLHDAILKTQLQPQSYGRLSFLVSKPSPTLKGTSGSSYSGNSSGASNSVIVARGINVGGTSYTEGRRTRLTNNKEMMVGWAKGLFYWYPKRYSVGHVCKSK